MNQIVSNYNNGEDPHLKPLNEFYNITVQFKDFSRYEKAETLRAAKNN